MAEDLDSRLFITESTCLGRLTVETEHLPEEPKDRHTHTHTNIHMHIVTPRVMHTHASSRGCVMPAITDSVGLNRNSKIQTSGKQQSVLFQSFCPV